MAKHPPVSKFWECHMEGCDREREGYSWWCVAHKDTPGGLRGPLLRCPCHGLLPSGMRTTVTAWYERTAALSVRELLGFLVGYGALGGEEIAEALNLKWPVVRTVLTYAISAGYVEHRGIAAYVITPLGAAWHEHGNRGARQRLRGRMGR